MHELLHHIIDAHGGQRHWAAHTSLSVDLAIGGMLWGMKGQAGVLDRTTVTVKLGDEWASHHPFGSNERRSRFSPGRVTIEDSQANALEVLVDPRASFTGHTLETPWSKPQLAYFAGYAMWTYLNLPFLALHEKVTVEAMPVWRENEEQWHPLRLTFPDDVATHSKIQTIYAGDDGLLRRHDYSVEIAANSPAAHYVGDYVTVDGIAFPTRRRVYVASPEGTPMTDLLTVSIDLSNFRFDLSK